MEKTKIFRSKYNDLRKEINQSIIDFIKCHNVQEIVLSDDIVERCEKPIIVDPVSSAEDVMLLDRLYLIDDEKFACQCSDLYDSEDIFISDIIAIELLIDLYQWLHDYEDVIF
jgi:hypothetical protein